MTAADIPDGMVSGWFEHQRLAGGTRAQRSALERGEPAAANAAYEWVEERLSTGSTGSIAVVVALARAAVTPRDVISVAAGPVESLLYDHGDIVVDALIEQARRDPAVAGVVRHVALASGVLTGEAIARLRLWAPQVTS